MSQNQTDQTQVETRAQNRDEDPEPIGAKILIVDDIPANLNLLREALEPEDYEILGATSGEMALQIATRAVPDLILLDIVMPGIDGFETCRRLKADPKTADIPVIFITAKEETENVVEGFRVGGVDYITKPFRNEEVRVRVQTHLTIKRLRDGLQEANNQLEAENARKTEELERARIIQQGFLPLSIPELPYLEIAAFQKPATEVGGDYYDFFPGEDGKFILAIGDAVGHDVGASLMVSATKTALLTINEPELTEKISEMNTVLKQVNSNRLLNMALVLIELSHDAKDTVQVKAAGGGMPPFHILRACPEPAEGSNGSIEEIVIKGMPLGIMEAVRYTPIEFRLEKSDVLILMSDGLPERLNDKDEMLSDARLAAKISEAGKTKQSAKGILDALVEYGNDWSNGTPQNDDVTLVVLKVK
ncbi:response regulator [bacterium]|nr:response regulator [bacterium]